MLRTTHFLFALATACTLVTATQASGSIITYDVTGFVDVADDLIIKRGTMQWSHPGSGATVGRHGGIDVTTKITTAVDAVTQMSAVQWLPSWPEPVPSEIRYAATSSVLTTLIPALPAELPNDVSASVVSGRGTVTITQYPTAANDYTLIARFADGASGAANTRGLITVDVPEPGAAASALALCGAFLVRRRRRERSCISAVADAR